VAGVASAASEGCEGCEGCDGRDGRDGAGCGRCCVGVVGAVSVMVQDVGGGACGSAGCGRYEYGPRHGPRATGAKGEAWSL
jgi:hypothetical protein